MTFNRSKRNFYREAIELRGTILQDEFVVKWNRELRSEGSKAHRTIYHRTVLNELANKEGDKRAFKRLSVYNVEYLNMVTDKIDEVG